MKKLLIIALLILGCSKDDDIGCECDVIVAHGRTFDINLCMAPDKEILETKASVKELELFESNSNCR